MGARMCGGARTPGGVYLVCKTSPFGLPLEAFLIDPPEVFDPEALGLASLGVKIIERAGIYHVADRVGREHYPNAWDFFAEAKRDPGGISRKVSPGLDWHLLGPGSRMLIAHDKAHIVDPFPYLIDRPEILLPAHVQPYCPREMMTHKIGVSMLGYLAQSDIAAPMCAALLREDVVGGERLPDRAEADRVRIRKMATPDGVVFGSYRCAAAPVAAVPEYRPAFFLSVPISAVEIVAGDGAERRAEKIAGRTELPVEIVSE